MLRHLSQIPLNMLPPYIPLLYLDLFLLFSFPALSYTPKSPVPLAVYWARSGSRFFLLLPFTS
jgi:hypothetical protein